MNQRTPLARPESKTPTRFIPSISLKDKKGFRNSLLLLLLLNLLVIFALYQTQPKYTLDIGSAGDEAYIDNFYDRETSDTGNHRWTTDQSSVVLPVIGSPFTIEMAAIVFRPNPITNSVSFNLNWNKASLSKAFETPPDKTTFAELNTYTLEGSAKPQLELQNDRLTIKTDTFEPGKGDLRQLGIVVNQITMQAHKNSFGFVLPPLIPWFWVGLGLLSVQSCLALIFSRRKLVGSTNQILFFSAALLLPLAMVVTFFVATTFYLTQTLVLSIYLSLTGLNILAVLLFKQRAFPWLGLNLALAILANLYRALDFKWLMILCLSLLILCLIYNIRFEQTRLNLLFISIITTLASWGLLQELTFRTTDAERHHYYWLNELDYLLHQGEFYPRWATDFAFGHGNAVLNFYAPLSRYLGEIFVLGGMQPAFAFHAVLIATSTLGAFGMYFVARQYLAAPYAVLVAVAYLYNPYRLANIYQRGAIAEAVAFGFLPFLLLALNLLLKLDFSFRKGLVLGAGAYALVLCTHQLTGFFSLVFLVGPYLLLNLVWFLFQEKSKGWKQAIRKLGLRAWRVGLTLGLGVGLSAFYLLPAFVESGNIRLGSILRYKPNLGLIDLNNSGRLGEWVAHIEQIKSSTLGLDNLAWIGLSHLVLAGLGLLLVLLPLGEKSRQIGPVILASLIVALYLVMQTTFSSPFWENVPFMRYIEFPWRLMIFVGLFTPLLIGFLAERVIAFLSKLIKAQPHRISYKIMLPVVLFSFMGILIYTGAGNIVIFFQKPEITGSYSQAEIFKQFGDSYYLPLQVTTKWQDLITANPDAYAKPYLERNSQPTTDLVTMERTSPTRFQLKADLPQPGTLTIPVFYFPGWKLTSQGQTLPIGYNQTVGFITAQLPAGSQTLELVFEDTPIRSGGVALSVVSLLSLASIFVTGRRKSKT